MDLRDLSTAHLADGCRRLGLQVRCAPAELSPVARRMRCFGRVSPVHHVGSVDVILEAMDRSAPGDVLVVDNGGRRDEACIGDLMALEAQLAGFAGIVIWGKHRDTQELLEIGLPVFSLGAIASGPQRDDPRPHDVLHRAQVGPWLVTAEDCVFCDCDGVLFVPLGRLPEVAVAARRIHEKEQRHTRQMRAGVSLREQMRFREYQSARAANPSLSFRDHLSTALAMGDHDRGDSSAD